MCPNLRTEVRCADYVTEEGGDSRRRKTKGEWIIDCWYYSMTRWVIAAEMDEVCPGMQTDTRRRELYVPVRGPSMTLRQIQSVGKHHG